MILIETMHKTQNCRLLAIIKALKTWCQYFKNYKYEVFIFTDYNQLC